MKKRGTLFLSFLILCIFLGHFIEEKPQETLNDTQGNLVVSYIDVGQGDSTFIEFPGGKTALIDAGETGQEDAVIDYLLERRCRKIDYVICTHPHSDHIGGMAAVIERFDIGEMYMPRAVHNSRAFENLLLTAEEKNLTVRVAKAGLVIEAEPGALMTFVAPCSDTYEELNDYSAAVRLTYQENAFLFTGDAEQLSEEEMLQSGMALSANVLKVGHHGSSSSSHKRFLEAVAPQFAVISCGAGNDYGHPHKAVLNRLKKMNVQLFRTDMDGTVVAVSDGKTINFQYAGGY